MESVICVVSRSFQCSVYIKLQHTVVFFHTYYFMLCSVIDYLAGNRCSAVQCEGCFSFCRYFQLILSILFYERLLFTVCSYCCSYCESVVGIQRFICCCKFSCCNASVFNDHVIFVIYNRCSFCCFVAGHIFNILRSYFYCCFVCRSFC